jgi:hypothetical protein
MSKKFLKEQANELLSSELKEIKGGTSIIAEDCTTCTGSCMTCSPGCSKKTQK